MKRFPITQLLITHKFITIALIISAVLVVLDLAIGTGLRVLYFTQKQGRLYNLTRTMEQSTSEILIFGSSRAENQYNPAILSDSMGMTCYNAGYAGQSVLYHKALLEVIVERYIPQLVIIDIKTYELDKMQADYDKLSALNPYIKRHPVIRETLSLRKYEKIKHLSNIYPFNSLFARIIMGHTGIQTKDSNENGFSPIEGVWTDSLKPRTFNNDKPLDINKINAFNRIISICKENDIQLVAVISPSFENQINTALSISYMISVCNQNEIPVINFTNSADFRDNRLFHDTAHLNATGADIFTSKLAGKIMQNEQ